MEENFLMITFEKQTNVLRSTHLLEAFLLEATFIKDDVINELA